MLLQIMKKCLERLFRLSIACMAIHTQMSLLFNRIGLMERNPMAGFLFSLELHLGLHGNLTLQNPQTGLISVARCQVVVI